MKYIASVALVATICLTSCRSIPFLGEQPPATLSRCRAPVDRSSPESVARHFLVALSHNDQDTVKQLMDQNPRFFAGPPVTPDFSNVLFQAANTTSTNVIFSKPSIPRAVFFEDQGIELPLARSGTNWLVWTGISYTNSRWVAWTQTEPRIIRKIRIQR